MSRISRAAAAGAGGAFAALRATGLRCATVFFSQVCLRRAALEKTGRSVCRGCAARLRGVEYPLRDPSLQPLYLTGRDACEALDMIED